MSRFLTRNEDGTYLEEIESTEVCRWRINEVCCNDKCECLGDYPINSEQCFKDCDKFWKCPHFEEDDGKIDKND